jgi:hypothetical protein
MPDKSHSDNGVDQSDWNISRPDKIPQPTFWPVALALGATLTCWGLITSLIITGVGAALFAVSLAGWIGDIRHE